MSNELYIENAISGRTTYALIKNSAGLFWDAAASAFEAYDTASRGDYDVALTELGTASGIFQADFPSAITSSGTYRYVVYQYAEGGASPSESDIYAGGDSIDWTGSSSIVGATGSMTGSEWQAYLLRCGFKRTDKDTELYEATTDAIQIMRRRFMFDEAEAETTTTDTISVAGDFKITIESDFGLLLGIMLEDDDTGTPLQIIPKWRFDQLYPSINVETDRGYPRHASIYAGSIYIGPIPDSTDYVYRKSYSRRAGTITSSTTGVPFTNLYRDVLADLTQSLLYGRLDEPDQEVRFLQKFENGFSEATRRERVITGEHCFNVRPFNI